MMDCCNIQGGKGRTGVFISAFLLWSGHRRTALDALELFTFRRSENYKPEASPIQTNLRTKHALRARF